MSHQNSFPSGLKSRLGTIRELFAFLWARKLWWLMPMLIILIAFILLLIFAQSSALGPFIYTLF